MPGIYFGYLIAALVLMALLAFLAWHALSTEVERDRAAGEEWVRGYLQELEEGRRRGADGGPRVE